jgi:hypothetical protein
VPRAARDRFLVATLAAMPTLAVAAGGCSKDTPLPSDVDSPYLAGKIPAIKRGVERMDPAVARQLVRDLNSADPAVRFFAIEGLRRMTDQTFGYVYYADDDQRKPAVQRWRQWMEEMEKK